MTTKVVDMEALKKLIQFQFLLKKRKFGICDDKMVDFVDYVQIISQKEPIATLQPVSVSHTTILINDELTVAKYRIATLEQNEGNKVTIKFKKPFWTVGTFISFVFRNGTAMKYFLDAVGEVTTDDESSDQATTPPTSEEDSS